METLDLLHLPVQGGAQAQVVQSTSGLVAQNRYEFQIVFREASAQLVHARHHSDPLVADGYRGGHALLRPEIVC